MQSKIKRKFSLGQIHVYTGDGKGKTTAGLGLALRASGQGKKVAIIFFDKGGFEYGERHSLPLLKNVDFFVTGLVRFKPGTPFRFSILDEDKAEAERGLQLARALFTKGYDLIILDEINTSTKLKMLKLRDVLQLMQDKPEQIEMVLTGRRAPKKILEGADLVTEMKLKKHYFYKGIAARQGIEY